MMPINNLNNDQNINRVYTKMSEDFTHLNSNAKLSNSVQTLNYYKNPNHGDNTDGSLDTSCDHLYSTSTENTEIIPEDANCQGAESEVRFLKEWLMLHLDLIQQQNDEILDKEKTIIILQQENAMLKEKIHCMERGKPFQPEKYFKKSPKYEGEENFEEDMTQNSSVSDEDNKSSIRLLDLNCDNGNNCSLELSSYELNISDNQLECAELKQSCSSAADSEPEIKPQIKLENGVLKAVVSETENIPDNSTESNPIEPDCIKTLKTTIRRKRLCSGSSLLSNNDSAPETETSKRTRKLKKKRKRYLKDEQILTTSEHYVSLTGDINPCRDQELAVEMATAATPTLEVPRWRIKVYASCYTMEGTENLDDEVYNKRHSRLEIDERRRKRWDVQRIREQRVIEKLKQRQERIESGGKVDESVTVQSFNPRLEDVRFLSVTEQLPVMAFGCPIPKREPSEFSLPWLNNPNAQVRKMSTKKTTSRRRATKR